MINDIFCFYAFALIETKNCLTWEKDMEIKNLDYYNSYYNIFQSVLFYIFF